MCARAQRAVTLLKEWFFNEIWVENFQSYLVLYCYYLYHYWAGRMGIFLKGEMMYGGW